jgi:CBS domain-containing protein
MVSAVDLNKFRVAAYMTSKPISVESHNSFHDALYSMGQHHVGSCVIMKDGEPLGILTERQILWYLSIIKEIPNTPLELLNLEDFSKISSHSSIMDAAKLMIESKKRILVFDDKLDGIITASDIVRAIKDMETNLSLKGVITNRVYTANFNDSLLSGIKTMKKYKIGSVIVTKTDGKERSYGIFTERDLFNKMLLLKKNLDQHIGKFCSKPLITAFKHTISAKEATEIMSKNNIKRLPLVEEGNVSSIVTSRDLVEALTRSIV